jgi:hypothetical protein
VSFGDKLPVKSAIEARQQYYQAHKAQKPQNYIVLNLTLPYSNINILAPSAGREEPEDLDRARQVVAKQSQIGR